MFAACFRNLNLRQSHNPTRAQLERAFSGAATAMTCLGSGAIVFTAGSEATARDIIGMACKRLKAKCGLQEPAFKVRLVQRRA